MISFCRLFFFITQLLQEETLIRYVLFKASDSRKLPCDFDHFDRNQDGGIDEEEFHVVTEHDGFWREPKLFVALSKGMCISNKLIQQL